MAVYYNLKGTTQPFFQIGKGGATLYPSDTDPTGTHTVVDGDYWLDTTGTIRTRVAGAWALLTFDNISINGNTISSTDIDGDINLIPNGTGEVVIGTDATGPSQMIAPDDTDLIIEAGTGVAASDAGDLYLRAGVAAGTGADGTVFVDQGGMVIGAATGGDQGIGTINATDLFVNGVSVRGWTNTTTATSVTASAWERVFVTASGQTITLPASPADGTEVVVSVVGTFTDTVVARNLELLMGLTEDMTLDQPNISVHLVYVNSTLGWRVI